MAVVFGGSTIAALTTSYQTMFDATSPWGAGSNGSPIRAAIVRGSGVAIVVQVTTKTATSATADTRELYGADGQDLIVTCDDLAFQRIIKIEVKGASATGSAYCNVLMYDNG